MTPDNTALLIWKGKTVLADYAPGQPLVTTLLGAVTYSRHKDELSLYDAAGKKWRCSGVSLATGPVTLLHHIATFCLINPTRPCTFDWGEPVPYEYREISEIVREEILADDDIVTQWNTKDKCLDIVAKARDLKELIAVYRRLTRT